MAAICHSLSRRRVPPAGAIAYETREMEWGLRIGRSSLTTTALPRDEDVDSVEDEAIVALVRNRESTNYHDGER
ncbi:uncharacterized protein SPSK_10209 [Sporothrix schenckii 1099-18]|uniref:Uncharacterized protein n=1 Tax=Sporothrix schenckii 1099-18 TaxID=1397361 RepID=A0A0F2M7B1_SPOSC|nr:uncharacterized protein SPSK_10209 [Sporothrix schenckii 1099-18]KJR85522.1 hypothetical protein SPSK_10209 [Sporothrix schenckii 1099-18]